MDLSFPSAMSSDCSDCGRAFRWASIDVWRSPEVQLTTGTSGAYQTGQRARRHPARELGESFRGVRRLEATVSSGEPEGHVMRSGHKEAQEEGKHRERKLDQSERPEQ